MSLLSLRKTSLKSYADDVLAKSKKINKSKTTIKGGNSRYEKIKSICDLVEQRLGHLKDEFISIQDENELNKYITKAIENGYIAIDTETTGLDPITDEIVGACIYTPECKPAYIPINHISLITNVRLNNQLTNEQVANQFKRLKDANTKIIYFNAKFDIRVMRHQLGIELEPYWDGFIAAKVLKENEEEGNLKYLWKKYCSPDKDAEHFTFDKMFQGYCFNVFPINVAYLYAAKDAIMTWELFKFQEPYLTKSHPRCIECGFERLADLYHNIEMSIINFVSQIEDNGIAIDLEYIKTISEKYHKLLDEKIINFNNVLQDYKDQILQYKNTHPNCKLEDPINISSPTQLAELFYDVLKLDSVSRKQPRGTGEEILEKLNHPLCNPILEFRGVKKLLTTYIDKMPEIANKKTGRIHCGFKQYGTDCLSGDTIIPNLEFPGATIAEICETNIPNMDYGIYYPLQITIFNRYGNMESTSHCVKFKQRKVKCITFNDNSTITGTYDHPILMSDNVFKELQYIEVGDEVKSINDQSLSVIDITTSKCDVYDFKVPQTHSFISNQVVSHNTGRFSCIAAGTLISCPSGDKKIEDIKPGDYVYSYDESGKLVLNKVLNNWFTGNKKCVKLSWVSKYNKKLNGYLICTPEHSLKTTQGWVRASEITPQHSIYHVHRRINKNHVSLYGQYSQGNEEEHVWIRDNFFNAKNGMYIHHKDSNRLNNDPNNLQIVTPKQHIQIHRQMKNGYCRAYDFTKDELIQKCKEVNWDIRKINHDYASLKRWLKQYKINYIKQYSDCYYSRPASITKSGKSFKYKSLPLIKDNLVYALELANYDVQEAASYFGQNSHKFINYCNKFNLLPNHTVIKVEYLSDYYSVYDLEVENSHCFIANELCVHNSSDPNLQNIPSHNKDIRPMFVASAGHILIGCDFSQQEPKLTADLSNDEQFIADCASGKDAYAIIASIAFEVPYEECLEFRPDGTVNKEGKERRGMAKVILLGICYGKTIKSIATDMHVSEEKAQEIYDAVMRNIPGLKRFMEESQEMARVHGWVETKWGRRRHIPDMQLPPYEIISEGTKNFDPFFDSAELGVINDTERLKQNYLNELYNAKYFKQKQNIKERAAKDGFKIKDNNTLIEDAKRQCVNSRIQGSAADQTKIAMQNIYKNKRLKELGWRTLLLVHDEIIGECPVENAKECAKLFSQCMLDSAKELRTGAKCDASYSFRWYGEEIDVENLSCEDLVKLSNSKV